ncbi:MAG: nucleotidyltransferase family protein [Lentisphaerae bacterium]|nr:nucleotidyltransferase family protein [Lentisphaerota bacterium]
MKSTAHAPIDLLVACCVPVLSDSALARIRSLVTPHTDWAALADLAAFYRAEPILHDRLQSADLSDPPAAALLARLRNTQLANAVRSARLSHALGLVAQSLEAAAIPALFFKGPILAQEAYDDPSLRQFDDLDVLVPGPYLTRARTVIEALGYSRILGLPPSVEASPFRPATPLILRHHSGDHDVDLSGRLMHDYFSFRIAPTALWDEARTVTLDGIPLRTLSREVLFLFLCVHGTKHLWARPCWMADLAGLLWRQADHMDWDRVMALAHVGDGRRMLDLGVALAVQTYGAPAPPALGRGQAAHRSVAALQGEVMRRWAEEAGQPERDDTARLRFHLRARARLCSRLRYLLVRGLRPSHNDWRAVRLPGPLFPLYYPLRLLRLGAVGLRALVRSAVSSRRTTR